ncbi:hypothetical protein HAX54_036658 [Datura stramonium]|uniref:Uncharacterized protein n=1 Tax=Datura stramonium TaxID=4076 RepID=A0ABS8VJJ3_DATST|nr:hypothetical protein [Datura stramonium]
MMGKHLRKKAVRSYSPAESSGNHPISSSPYIRYLLKDSVPRLKRPDQSPTSLRSFELLERSKLLRRLILFFNGDFKVFLGDYRWFFLVVIQTAGL